MFVGCYRSPVCGFRLGHRIHYPLRPTKCRYARVDKAAPADYTITSCRGTKSASNLVDSKHKLLRPPFAVLANVYQRASGETPLDYVFDIFAAFARTVRVIERFFFTFCLLPLLPGFREAERPDTVAKNEICSVIASRVKTIHC